VGTKEFAAAVCARVGQKPTRLKPVEYAHRVASTAAAAAAAPVRTTKVEVVGVDLYVAWPSLNPNELAAAVEPHNGDGLTLQMIDNRGVKVWPAGSAETFCTDSFRCRFMAAGTTTTASLIGLMQRVNAAGIDIVKIESLRNYDGQAGYTLAQGQ
jgi:isocitrate dehydrogenase